LHYKQALRGIERERYGECIRGWPPIAQVVLSERERTYLEMASVSSPDCPIAGQSNASAKKHSRHYTTNFRFG
jgi:hypothetical protein